MPEYHPGTRLYVRKKQKNIDKRSVMDKCLVIELGSCSLQKKSLRFIENTFRDTTP